MKLPFMPIFVVCLGLTALTMCTPALGSVVFAGLLGVYLFCPSGWVRWTVLGLATMVFGIPSFIIACLVYSGIRLFTQIKADEQVRSQAAPRKGRPMGSARDTSAPYTARKSRSLIPVADYTVISE